ncbi:oxidoreductase [Zalerion maritima]|uniref:Oxidoreductase n=1 Tax=Zalerion maritima TaxID=339359 RepID=A0AAD5RZC6_9PEZI|nr:oxidoreductase [Zalerion maritima]
MLQKHFSPAIQDDGTINQLSIVVSSKSVSPPPPPPSSQDGTDNPNEFPPDPNSRSSTITTVTKEITLAGGIATAIPVDVRDPASIDALVAKTVETYGRIDVLIYNPGAIYWAPVSRTPLSRFLLMQSVNTTGLYAAEEEEKQEEEKQEQEEEEEEEEAA